MASKIIVKVGNKSELKFSHSKVYRAITTEELEGLANKHDDCNIVIIENITEDEEDAIKSFVINYKKKNEANKVLFYVPNNEDEITSGVADELEYEIYLTVEDIYNYINSTFNMNVSILLKDKRIDIDDSINIFGTEGIEVENKDTEKEVSLDKQEEEKPKTDLDKQEEEKPKANLDKQEEEKPKASLKKEEPVELIKEPVEEEKKQSANTQVEKDLKKANKRISELEDIIKAVTDEKNTLIERYNTLVETTDILEDPISLLEYESLKSELASKDSIIKELTNNDEVESFKLDLGIKESQIVELENTIKELNESKQSLELQLVEYETKSKDLETKISELEHEIEQSKAENEEQKETLATLVIERESIDNKLKTLEEEKEQLQSSIDTISKEKASLEIDKETLEEEINNLETSLDNVKQALLTSDEKLKEIENTINEKETILSEKEDKIVELNNQLSSAEQRIQLNMQFTDTEINRLEAEVTNVKQQLTEKEQEINTVKQQLTEKEQEVNTVKQRLTEKEQELAKANIEANGASVLVEANKVLDATAKTLREQLSVVSKELESYRQREETAQESLRQYQAQYNQLADSIRNVGIGISNPVVNSGSYDKLVNPIIYRGQAQVVNVLGSGSFGITTTAMSLAYRLGAISKVLYVDFDLMSPKADTWFNKAPFKKIPGMDLGLNMTALGVFLIKGVTDFKKNFNSLVTNCDITKGGRIDCLNGIYNRLSNKEIASADYSEWLNFLSTKYDYIVIDFGKLGCSELNDNLIQSFTSITNKNVVVTTVDKYDIRNFKMKLEVNNIDLSTISWLLNMCETTSLDSRIRSSLSTTKGIELLIKDTSLQGKREKFTSNRLNKDRLEMFMDSILFKH